MSRAAGNYLRMRDRMIKPDLLILDDFGLRKLSSTEAHDLCEILEIRSIGKSTLVTTQLPIDHWAEVIEDPVIADAIIDRLMHTSLKITITGESYRRKKAQALEQNSREKR
jgi:DNA replication protein DnaC